ncbi:MAG: FlgD immunoglobulin-like domain containing protein [Candidatus Zixiibacteriota bacterium]
MKRVIAFIILYSSFLILCPGANAQWEGAEVQRLTYDDLPNETIGSYNLDESVGLFIDEADKLHLFYLEGVRDTLTGFVYDYTIFHVTKQKGGHWSQPEEIETPEYAFGQNQLAQVCMDTRTNIVHILYRPYTRNILYYTNSTITGWEFVKIDSLFTEPNRQYYSFAMALDTLGDVHVAWHVDFDSVSYHWYRVMYANNSTGEWVKQQVSEPIFLGGFGSGPTYFDVQKNGTVHIVYETVLGSGTSYYARNDSLNGTYWHIDTVPRPPRPLYYYGGAIIKAGVNDRLHLITGGCIQQDCLGPGRVRRFYYYKHSEDSIWVGPELILDSLYEISRVYIDRHSIPYVMEWSPYDYCHFFGDRGEGFWREPYQIFDTASICYTLSSIYVRRPSFVLDSDGRGHAVFSGSLFGFMGQSDSLEIYYYGPPFTSVEDTLAEQAKLSFELFQNYPNPFNSVTSIRYTVSSGHDRSIHTILKIYNILGKEVRELVNTNRSRGSYTVSWDGKNNFGKEVASGIYFYQLTVRQAHRPEQSRGRAGDYRDTKKLVLVK